MRSRSDCSDFRGSPDLPDESSAPAPPDPPSYPPSKRRGPPAIRMSRKRHGIPDNPEQSRPRDSLQKDAAEDTTTDSIRSRSDPEFLRRKTAEPFTIRFRIVFRGVKRSEICIENAFRRTERIQVHTEIQNLLRRTTCHFSKFVPISTMSHDLVFPSSIERYSSGRAAISSGSFEKNSFSNPMFAPYTIEHPRSRRRAA